MSVSSMSRDAWLADIRAALVEEFGMDLEQAEKHAAGFLDKICKRRPAGEYYFPARRKDARNAGIIRDFNGQNMQEVKKKYNVSRSTVYSVASSKLRRMVRSKPKKKSLRRVA